jgi:uncharacterized membrane protein YagU involved in acid resistance
MLHYLVISALLFVLSVASEAMRDKSLWFGWCATIVAILFAGLRFETGHDWLNYSLNYETSAPVWALGDTSLGLFLQEPLFYAAASIFRALGASTQIWFFAIAAVGMLGIHYAATRITKNVAFVWSVYFGIAYAIGPLMLLRQSVAAALVLVALVLVCERRWPAATLATAAATGVHITSVAGILLFPLAGRRPPLWLCVMVLAAGLFVAVYQINLIELIATPLISLLPDHIAFKLAWYSALQPAPVTWGGIALVTMHIAILAVLVKLGAPNDRFVTIGIWLTLFVIAAQLFLFGLPTIWNRVLIVSLPWQVAAFWRVASEERAPIIARYGILLGFSALATAALTYFLSKPSAVPYVPYQSVVSFLAPGDGCGLERLQAAQAMAQRVAPDQIPEHLLDADLAVAQAAAEAHPTESALPSEDHAAETDLAQRHSCAF